jgi:membrane carboxypeptidase/penicillin-binding protein
MEAHAAIDGPGETVSPGAIDRVVAQHGENQERQQARQFSETERNQEEAGIERQENGDRDQEAEQELACSAGIFKALARELGVGP